MERRKGIGTKRATCVGRAHTNRRTNGEEKVKELKERHVLAGHTQTDERTNGEEKTLTFGSR
jgi:hypothetical protein